MTCLQYIQHEHASNMACASQMVAMGLMSESETFRQIARRKVREAFMAYRGTLPVETVRVLVDQYECEEAPDVAPSGIREEKDTENDPVEYLRTLAIEWREKSEAMRIRDRRTARDCKRKSAQVARDAMRAYRGEGVLWTPLPQLAVEYHVEDDGAEPMFSTNIRAILDALEDVPAVADRDMVAGFNKTVMACQEYFGISRLPAPCQTELYIPRVLAPAYDEFTHMNGGEWSVGVQLWREQVYQEFFAVMNPEVHVVDARPIVASVDTGDSSCEPWEW